MSVDAAVTRRRFLQLSAIGASALLAACASGAPKETPVPPTAESAAAPDQTPSGPPDWPSVLGPELPGSPDHPSGFVTTIPDPPPGMPLKPPLVITSNRLIDGTTTWARGDTAEDNVGTRFIKKALGIEWKMAWANDWEDSEQKFNLAMAAGTLPDFMELVPFSVFRQMVEADLVEDLTDIYEAEASEQWIKKPLREWAGEELAFAFCMVNGRKMALPQTMIAAQDDVQLFARQDWLDQVGLDVPTNLDELAEVSLAFQEANLGLGSTYGLFLCQSGVTYGMEWYGAGAPLFGAFGVIPGFWTKDGDTLMWDDIRPQTKEALALLRDWYAKGVINQDFSTLTSDDATRVVEGGQCGLWIGSPSNATYGTTGALQNDARARFSHGDIPMHPVTGVKNRGWTNPWVDGLHCFRKGYEHIDAVIQQGNFMAELMENPRDNFHGWEGYQYEWDGDTIVTGQATFKGWFGFIGTPGGGGADPNRRYNYYKMIEDEWTQIPPEKRDGWMRRELEDPTGLMQFGRQVYMFAAEHTNEGIKNRLTTLPTPTMIAQGEVLDKMRDETKIGIIRGELPLSAFDDFVEQWKKQGGEKVIEEVNEWWSQSPLRNVD